MLTGYVCARPSAPSLLMGKSSGEAPDLSRALRETVNILPSTTSFRSRKMIRWRIKRSLRREWVTAVPLGAMRR